MTLLAVVLVFLHGTVTIGPTSPVCSATTPCTKPAAHVLLRFVRPGRKTLTIRTDGAGRYHVRLAPGTWTVRTVARTRVQHPRFWVARHPRVHRNFFVDTGIR
jgi:hypothetical protein